MVDGISRRDVLASAGAGLGALLSSAGSAAAGPSERYIVGTRTETATEAAKQAADAVARDLDFGGIGRAIAGVYPPEALDGLRNRPGVRYIEPDGRYHAIGETVPWGIDRINADVVHDNGETGGDGDAGGADIAIIDTGIDDTHADLHANLGEGAAFVECQGSTCTYAWSDDNNHGTHCAGIADAADNDEGVIGVSTEAVLHAVKVLDEDGSGYWSDVAAGIEWVADQGYDVGSLSLGGSSSSTVRDACQYAAEKGVLLVAAAGNEGPCTDCVGYPAKYPTVMAVSAVAADDSLADFSSTGAEIDLAAPGVEIYSTIIDGYATFSGTSMACPHAAGVGAQLMDNGYTNTEARQRLTATAEDLGLASTDQGAGLLDAEAAVLDGSNESPSCAIVAPRDGETVSGTVPIHVDASDSEDSDDSLSVAVSIGGSSYRTALYDSTGGYYEYDWETTELSDGEYTIDARATDGDGATTHASQITVHVANSEPALAVTTGDATTITQTTATLTGSLDDVGGASSADVYFEYGERDTTLETTSGAKTLDSAGSFSIDVSGLSAGADYEYRAVAAASDGGSDSGATRSFRTQSSNSAPSASLDSMNDRSNPAWDRFAVQWSVTDTDGNLDSVVVELLDAGGAVLDSASTAVSGSSASGRTEVRTKQTVAEIRVTATDTMDATGVYVQEV